MPCTQATANPRVASSRAHIDLVMRTHDLSYVHQRTNNLCGLSCLSTHVPDLSIPSGLAPVRRRGVIHPGGDFLLYPYSYSYFLLPGQAMLLAPCSRETSRCTHCTLHLCLVLCTAASSPRCLLVLFAALRKHAMIICRMHM